MRRNLLTAIVLAALSVSSANGSTVRPAKAHRHAQTTPAAHMIAKKAGRATPQEVGRAAGLKIRRDLALRQAAKSTAHHAHPTQAHGAVAAEAPRQSRTRAARTPEVASAPAAIRARKPALQMPKADASRDPGSAAEAQTATNASPFAAANPFSQSRPYAEPGSSSETGTTADADPVPATQTRSKAETRVKESETASADPEPVAATLTRRAALRAVSLRTSRFGMPAPLVGSRAILEHQNAMSDAEGLERIEDEDDLADRIAKKMLVPVPTSIALIINGNLPVNHRYCRPWTALFLSDLARSHAAEFRRPLEVSSAVRTIAYQKRLMEINGNAAAAEGDIVSPHLTGATIDIAKSPLSRQEIAWMRTHLLPLEQAGKIDVEEEFQQACFHITVYKSYAPARRATRSTTVMAKSAKPEAVQPEAGQMEVAQADIAPAPVSPNSSHHAYGKHRRHARTRVVAQVDDPVGAMAARGR